MRSGFWWGDLRVIDRLEGVVVGARIILKKDTK